MLGTSKKDGGKGKHEFLGKGKDTANKIQESLHGKRKDAMLEKDASKHDTMLGENTRKKDVGKGNDKAKQGGGKGKDKTKQGGGKGKDTPKQDAAKGPKPLLKYLIPAA